jgi:hypothetical protein
MADPTLPEQPTDLLPDPREEHGWACYPCTGNTEECACGWPTYNCQMILRHGGQSNG